MRDVITELTSSDFKELRLLVADALNSIHRDLTFKILDITVDGNGNAALHAKVRVQSKDGMVSYATERPEEGSRFDLGSVEPHGSDVPLGRKHRFRGGTVDRDAFRTEFEEAVVTKRNRWK